MKSALLFIISMLMVAIIACNSQTPSSLPPESFASMLQSTKNAIILDVRTPGEFAGGFIAGATNVDYNSDSFETSVNVLDKSKPYFVYCLSGGRSSSAASLMRKKGFTTVYELKGGILAWQKNNLPLTTSHAAPIPSSSGMSMDAYKQLTQASATPVLIDFYAPWCGPCKKMEPILKVMEQSQQPPIRIVRINVDENKELARQLGIEAIPVVKIYRDGAELWSHSGFADRAMILRALNNGKD